MFSPKAQELMRYPVNIGELKDADGIGTAGNPAESTFMKMWIKVNDGIISAISFKVFGCLPNAATGSVVTEYAKNKTLREAALIDEARVLAELGGLPQDKRHCAGLAVACLRSAISDATRDKREGEE